MVLMEQGASTHVDDARCPTGLCVVEGGSSFGASLTFFYPSFAFFYRLILLGLRRPNTRRPKLIPPQRAHASGDHNPVHRPRLK